MSIDIEDILDDPTVIEDYSVTEDKGYKRDHQVFLPRDTSKDHGVMNHVPWINLITEDSIHELSDTQLNKLSRAAFTEQKEREAQTVEFISATASKRSYTALKKACKALEEIYIDSGAEGNFFGNRDLLRDFERLDQNITIRFGNGQTLEGTHRAVLILKDHKMDVIYIPGMRVNLLSVISLLDSNNSVNFSSQGSNIIHPTLSPISIL